MSKKIREKSKIRAIVEEIAYDLGIDRKLVRQVLIFTFREVAVTLILRGRPVMIRRFVKFVIAAIAIRKMKDNKTKEKVK